MDKPIAIEAAYRNGILAALPISDIESLRPHLNYLTLVSGQVLHKSNRLITDVFFVDEGIVSLAVNTYDNGRTEVGLTGREGLVGASAVFNPEPYSTYRSFTQVPGGAYRMSTSAFRSAIDRSATLRDRCLRYVETPMAQSSQVAACNARHNLPERLARWSLMVRERIDSDKMPMTQEILSVMRGVRRSGVSVAASTLQAGGLIRVQRGHVMILDQDGLAEASCDCYRTIQASRERILG
jgi:CRP-like cAMP-binding protein